MTQQNNSVKQSGNRVSHLSGCPAAGKIVKLCPEKGFGFIRPNEGGRDVYMRLSEQDAAAVAQLYRGRRVTYRLVYEEDNSVRATAVVPQGAPSRDMLRVTRRPWYQGAVIKTFPGRGYGFIQPLTGGSHVFVHYSVLAQTGINPEHLGVGSKVQYQQERRDQGLRAIAVQLLE